jgi:hypothetical protein
VSENSVERLRQLWTPFAGIEQVEIDDAPQTRLDSMVRDMLHRTIQQKGPFTLKLEQHQQPVLNVGVLRWEIGGFPGYREVSLWIEEA